MFSTPFSNAWASSRKMKSPYWSASQRRNSQAAPRSPSVPFPETTVSELESGASRYLAARPKLIA